MVKKMLSLGEPAFKKNTYQYDYLKEQCRSKYQIGIQMAQNCQIVERSNFRMVSKMSGIQMLTCAQWPKYQIKKE